VMTISYLPHRRRWEMAVNIVTLLSKHAIGLRQVVTFHVASDDFALLRSNV
jgi:hypothetical protein